MVCSVPRLVVAAPQGRSGKTTVAVGLCAALAARGLAVQPFKKGPDYIDPSWLTEAAGRPCRTLDPFLMGKETVVSAFALGSAGADVAVIEGAMGLYDGVDLEGSGSTAAMARWLGAPILLVVSAQRMTRSVAALIQGYQRFEPETNIAGVILNHVVRDRHRAMLVQAIERYCAVPVVGILPRQESLAIPSRHLGLAPRGENPSPAPAVVAAREAVAAGFDLERILEIARAATPLDVQMPPLTEPPAPMVTIGVVRDRAFSFYYPENLEALRQAGARLVFVDALADAHLPPMDALYIGGGFPEVFLDELEANRSLRGDILAAIEDEDGLPVYAECGGLMYLSRGITYGERSGQMVGALPCEVTMTGRPQGHGYVEATVDASNPFFPVGAVLRGHEFHNSAITGAGDLPTAYQVTRGHGLDGRRDALVYKNVLAAYTHLHALATPEWAPGLVAAARRRKERR